MNAIFTVIKNWLSEVWSNQYVKTFNMMGVALTIWIVIMIIMVWYRWTQ